MNFRQSHAFWGEAAGALASLRQWVIALAVLAVAIPLGVPAVAQTAAPPPSPAAPAPGASGAAQGGAETTTTFSGSDENLSPDQLETLVSRIALYPDDLLALVLPASTQPVQIVQAQRLLDQRKTDPNAQPPKSWDPSVVGLLNYPEVIQLMNADLTWTEQLGTSVISQQTGVLDAIQAFRQKVAKAGNLKSDDHQKVTEADQKIVIESANPDVVYVPQYNTTTIVTPPAPGYPPPYYYSPPYPYYYSPAATFFTGAMFGAAIGYAIGWNNGGGIYSGDVNVNRNVNVSNVGNRTSNIQRSNLSNNITRNPENSWKADRNSVSRGQGQRGGGAGAATRPTSGQIQSGLANRGGAQGGGLQNRGGAQGGGVANRGGAQGGGLQNRGGAQAGNLAGGGRTQGGGGIQNRGGGGGQVGNAQRGGAFSGANRGGGSANRASNRGNQSLGGGRGGGGSRGGGGGARRR